MDLFMRINLSSAMILKTFSNALSPEKFVTLSSLCKITLLNIAKLRVFFKTPFNKLFENISAFLEVADYFYRGMMMYVALKLNMYEDKGLVKRTKDFKVNFVENLTLGKEIIRLVEELEKKNYGSFDGFNVEQNKVLAVAFFKKFTFVDADAFTN